MAAMTATKLQQTEKLFNLTSVQKLIINVMKAAALVNVARSVCKKSLIYVPSVYLHNLF